MTAAMRFTVLLVAACTLVAQAGCERAARDDGPSTLAARLTADQRRELHRTVTPPEWPEGSTTDAASLDVALDALRQPAIHVAGEGGEELPVGLELRLGERVPGAARGARVAYEVLDFYGRRVDSADLGEAVVPPRGSLRFAISLDGLTTPGAYLAVARATGPGGQAVALREFAIVPPTPTEPMPDSRFHTTDATGARVGCKVLYVKDLVARGAGVTNWQERTPERQWQPTFDVAPIAARLKEYEEAGLVVIGHLGPGHDAEPHALPGGGPAFGLPRDPDEFARATAPVVARLPAVAAWDILPEPLERLQASAIDLSRYLDLETRAILNGRGDLVDGLWVSGTQRLVNDLLTPRGASARGRNVRFTDAGDDPTFAAWVAKRVGADKWTARLDETAAPHDASPQRRAWALAKQAVGVLAAGGSVELGSEAVADPAPAAVMAALAQRLEGATFHADVWPGLDLVRSPVFALRGRRSAAVLWSRVTEDGTPSGAPCRGLVEIPDARHVAAEDCLGSAVGLWRERSLLVPLGEAPVYVTSDRLSAADLVRRLRAARVSGIAPVAVRVGTITSQVGPRATVPVHVVGLTGEAVEVEVALDGPRGWEPADGTKTVRVEPGREVRVAFRFRKAARNVDNAYPVTVRATVGDWSAERAGAACQAVAPRVAVAVDGRLDDWAAVPELTVPLVWPTVPGPATARVGVNEPTGSPVASLRAAHDDDFLYVAARMPMPEPLRRVRTVRPDGSPDGTPWGEGTIQLALGPAGAAEPSHVVALVPTARRPAVVRMLAPGMDPRNPVADLAAPLWGDVPGARVAIVEADGRAVYEAAIPRESLERLPWSRGSRWAMSLLVGGPGGEVQWPADADGFHWQRNRRVFFPLGRPCRAITGELGLVAAP